MEREAQTLVLADAADILGVSQQQLEQRIEAGELPEAHADNEGSLVIDRDQLAAIAQREGWIIDLRQNGQAPSPEFSEMLERLLGLGQQLIAETSARQVAESALERAKDDIAAAKREVRELDAIIEELDVENMKLGKDLDDANDLVRVSEAIAKERYETIMDLQATIEANRWEYQTELQRARRTQEDLRDRIELANARMSWWHRRRYLSS